MIAVKRSVVGSGPIRCPGKSLFNNERMNDVLPTEYYPQDNKAYEYLIVKKKCKVCDSDLHTTLQHVSDDLNSTESSECFRTCPSTKTIGLASKSLGDSGGDPN